jgi:hypothetical protein
MATRPSLAAFSCVCGRSYIRRAATFNFLSWTALPARSLPSRSSLSRVRSYAAPPTHRQDDDANTIEGQDPENGKPSDAYQGSLDSAVTQSEKPWYLQVEPPTRPPTRHISSLPTLPQNPPSVLEPMVKFVDEEMGLDSINIIDLRALDPPPALGPNLIMLFGSARSERHLHRSCGSLVRWLRGNYDIEASADGMISPAELKKKLRRLRRRAKLLGSSANVAGGADDGISTDWICVNLGTIGDTTGETARFDEGGKLTGFGTPVNGTTIVLQVMTEARRNELDLETLWSRSLARNKEAGRKLREDANENDFLSRWGPAKTFPSSGKGPRRLHRSRSQRLAIPSQRRDYSTVITNPTTHDDMAAINGPLLELRGHINDIIWSGLDVPQLEFTGLLRDIFHTSPMTNTNAEELIELTNTLLQTMHERSMPVLDAATAISIIEGIAHSGASSEAAKQLQERVQELMRRANLLQPNEVQLKRLLTAYAVQGNWDQFWEVWRVPPRFQVRRSPEFYSAIYQLVAKTKHQMRCIEALRWCYDEMIHEEPPVYPNGVVYDAIMDCISVADPSAIGRARNLVLNPGARTPGEGEWEFVDLVVAVESLRHRTLGQESN